MRYKKLCVYIGIMLIMATFGGYSLAEKDRHVNGGSVPLDPPFWEGTVTLIRNSTVEVVAHTSGKSYHVSGTTALAALHHASQMGDFDYTIDDTWYDQFGSLLVDSIEGKTSAGLDGWQFWVNYPHDEIPFTGADQYQVSEGDTVDFFYGGFGYTPESSSMNVKIYVHLVDDTTPPVVSLTKPGKGYLYLADRELLRIPSQFTFVLGKITVEANAIDNHTGVIKVEFSIDEELQAYDTEAPYEWRWTDTVIGRYTVQATAYDKNNNSRTAQTSVWIISF